MGQVRLDLETSFSARRDDVASPPEASHGVTVAIKTGQRVDIGRDTDRGPVADVLGWSICSACPWGRNSRERLTYGSYDLSQVERVEKTSEY